MSKKNRERRTGQGDPESAGGDSSSGPGLSWLPIVLAVVALGLGFMAFTDGKKMKADTTKRLVDIDTRITQLQTQAASAAKARPPAQQGPDPNKVYPVNIAGSPTRGNPTAPIVIAEFSDYQ